MCLTGLCVVHYMCLFGVLREDVICECVTRRSRWLKLLLRDNDLHCRSRKMKIVSSNWVVLSCRLLRNREQIRVEAPHKLASKNLTWFSGSHRMGYIYICWFQHQNPKLVLAVEKDWDLAIGDFGIVSTNHLITLAIHQTQILCFTILFPRMWVFKEELHLKISICLSK